MSTRVRNTAPAAARTAFVLYGSTVPSNAITPATPKAAAARINVPTFPGSWTPSRTSSVPAGRWAGSFLGSGHTSKTPLGRPGVGEGRELRVRYLNRLHARSDQSLKERISPAISPRRGTPPRTSPVRPQQAPRLWSGSPLPGKIFPVHGCGGAGDAGSGVHVRGSIPSHHACLLCSPTGIFPNVRQQPP